MSHELRNLLSAILGYNEILREELGDLASAEVREALERQALVARQSLEVIGVTLELSRGGVATSRSEEPLDPLRILDELQSEYSLRALPQNVVLRWDLSPDLPSISADPVKLKMILRNLIDNGLKFTPQGEVCVRVRPRLDELIFEVCDTGIGIPAEKQPFIFEPFQQAHDESRGRGGVGLGLYVASRLAEMLDGSLSVQSEVGKGSCFELRIPLSPSTPAREAST
jgi:signal transduction histidine kinase